MKSNLFRTFNSYSILMVHGLCNVPPTGLCLWHTPSHAGRWAVSMIVEKQPFVISDSRLWQKQPFVVLHVLLKGTVIWLISMRWIIVSVALKKWCFIWCSVYLRFKKSDFFLFFFLSDLYEFIFDLIKKIIAITDVYFHITVGHVVPKNRWMQIDR